MPTASSSSGHSRHRRCSLSRSTPSKIRASLASPSRIPRTRLQPKLAVAENIAQTAQFAESGNAQAGLISLTIASSEHFRSIGTFVRIPADAYQPIQQSGVILKSSKQPALAKAFLDWLTSPRIQQQLESFGLDPAK
jgi:molybdate transport system substrate-binding protein